MIMSFKVQERKVRVARLTIIVPSIWIVKIERGGILQYWPIFKSRRRVYAWVTEL